MKKNIWKWVKEYGTPLYVFDLDDFTERVNEIRTYLGENIEICYAMKANPFLTGTAASCVDRLEVCSPGEFAICERTQVPMEQIVLSGVYKEEQEIRRVLETYGGKGIYTAESVQQFELLDCLSKELGFGQEKEKLQVLLRLSSGNQFGMDEDTIKEFVRNREKFYGLRMIGIQYYSGTQKKREKTVEKEIAHLDEFLLQLKEEFSFEAQVLEYGPGFYVSYFQKEEDVDVKTAMTGFAEKLRTMKYQGKITLEIGRYLAAFCGSYITKIVDLKKTQDQPYAIVDGGIHHLNYFGQTMAMKIPYYEQWKEEECKNLEEETTSVTICGSLCTVSDVLVKNLPLVQPEIGDILVFQRTGAYSVTEAIHLFLSRDFPKIVFQSKKDGVRLVRDTIESNRFNCEIQ